MKKQRNLKTFLPMLVAATLLLVGINTLFINLRASKDGIVIENLVAKTYKDHIDCLDQHFKNRDGRSPRENCPFGNYAFTDKLIEHFNSVQSSDPMLCAQDIPGLPVYVNNVRVYPNRNAAEAIVHLSFVNDHPIKVNLENNGGWKISGISCSPELEDQ